MREWGISAIKRWRRRGLHPAHRSVFYGGAARICRRHGAGGSPPIPSGCILPLSGRNAAYGNRALDAVLLAAGVFNAARATPIRLLIEDSQSEPAVAGAAVAKLAGAGVTCHPRAAGEPGGPRGGEGGPAPEGAHPDFDAAGGDHRDRGSRLQEFPDGGDADPDRGSIRPGGARTPPICDPLPGRSLRPGDGASLPGGSRAQRR